MICTHPDILFGVGFVSRFMERPTITHFKSIKVNPSVYQRYCLLACSMDILTILNLWVIVIVATQFLTHVFDIFSKNPKIEKNKENQKNMFFNIFSSF